MISQTPSWSSMIEESQARPAGEGPVLEEIPRRFLRRRVDHRTDSSDWIYRFSFEPFESVEERNSRLGFGDPNLVKTVFVRRRDGLIRELPRAYDCRYFEYDGALTPRHPAVLARLNKDTFDPLPQESASTDSSGQHQSPRSPFREACDGNITLFPSLFSFIESNNHNWKNMVEVS
jgi:hypothetical protein